LNQWLRELVFAVVGSAIGAAMIALFGLNTKNRQLQLLQNFNLPPHPNTSPSYQISRKKQRVSADDAAW
jgi:hypothetical protein